MQLRDSIDLEYERLCRRYEAATSPLPDSYELMALIYAVVASAVFVAGCLIFEACFT